MDIKKKQELFEFFFQNSSMYRKHYNMFYPGSPHVGVAGIMFAKDSNGKYKYERFSDMESVIVMEDLFQFWCEAIFHE